MTTPTPLRTQNRKQGSAGRGDDGSLLRDFDLLDRIGVAIARFAGVALPERPPKAPRMDATLLREAAGAVVRDPAKRRVLLTLAGAVTVFSALVIGLLMSGQLGAFYELVWTRVGGRPWTHIMRAHPELYADAALVFTIVPFVLAPKGRWGRAFLTYVVFWVGFLGGHVFW